MGKLTVILGCMFAQKTTELLRYIRRYRSIGQNVLVVNSHRDTRYGSGQVISHDQDGSEEAHMVECLASLDADVRSGYYQVVAIDEGQFFPDLFDCVSRWADECPVHVIVAGLDGTFQREPFGHMLCLIPHAEEVLRLTALCAVCKDGTKAMYSRRRRSSEADTSEADTSEAGTSEADTSEADTTRETRVMIEHVETVIQIGSADRYQPVCRRHYLEAV
jgi:thymidine kinase